MEIIKFHARGHENIQSTHNSTIEITTETSLTVRGDCIIGVCATRALRNLPEKIKNLALSPETRIQLTLLVNGIMETIEGRGGKGLTYSSSVCMVARKSNYRCERTLMINADRAAIDLNRDFVRELRDPKSVIDCELKFIQ